MEGALEAARHANSSKSRFLAAASHDLRQPLHALTMFLGTLGFHINGGDARRLLGRATDTLRVLEEQFNSLLDLSRFDAGVVVANPRAFRLDELLRKVADEIGSQSVDLAEELILTNAELSYLQERKQAYENLASRTGLEPVKSTTQALIQAERYGTPVAQALRVLASESRDMRMNAAEKKAAALPPKLTVPMILFFLPVLFAIILGPAGIQVSERGIFGDANMSRGR